MEASGHGRAAAGRGRRHQHAAVRARFAREEDHALRDADGHLARRKVRDEDDLLADQCRRIGIRLPDAREDRARAERPRVEHELQELRAFRHDLATCDDADAQVKLLEVGERDLRLQRRNLHTSSFFLLPLSFAPRSLVLARAALVRDFTRLGRFHRRGGDHRLDLLRVDARGEVFVGAERPILDCRGQRVPRPVGFAEELHRLLRVGRENRLQVDREDTEGVQRRRQGDARRFGIGLHRLPRLLAVEILVRRVREPADLDDNLVEAAVFVELRNRLARRAQLRQKRQLLVVARERREASVQLLLQHLRRPRGDVRDLADEVGVDALDEVREIEVHIIRRAAELRRVVVAQGLRRQVVEVRARVHERALRLRHLLAVHREEAMHEDLVRALEARRVQHPRPEQAVETDDVLADEMVQLNVLGLGFGGARASVHPARPPVFEVLSVLRAPVLERRDVADRRIDPDVEELALVAGDLEAEVRRVARDAPAAQRLLEPFEQLVRDVARRVARNPLLQIGVLGLQLEVKMFGVAHDRRAAARRADRRT